MIIDKDFLNDVSEELLSSYQNLGGINHVDGDNLPDRQSIESILRQLKALLFPGYFEKNELTKDNIKSETTLKLQECALALYYELFKSLFWFNNVSHKGLSESDIQHQAEILTQSFLEQIPKIRTLLKEDEQAIFDGDPAAKTEPEIILAYPGFLAIVVYRIAHFLYKNRVPLIPRLMTEIAHADTGVDIHPGATIGSRFCIDHGTGLVIGETAILGDKVKLYQGVTIGALSVVKRDGARKRHPTIKNNVTIYARTTILGGDTVIGENCIIGGNVWLTHSVPDNAKVYLSLDAKQIVKVDSALED